MNKIVMLLSKIAQTNQEFDTMMRTQVRESFMRCLITLFLTAAFSISVSAQQQNFSTQQQDFPSHVGSGATTLSDTNILPMGKIGNDDLIGITVYDAPELTHSVRVGPTGTIRLPMIQRNIQAAGLNPPELEVAIKTALIEDNILVEPIVTVSILEYRSRPITIVGAVKNPITFQVSGTVTLLDALSRAGGITENAGSEILVSHSSSNAEDKSIILTERISLHALLSAEDPASNLKLEGGENIRVPEGGRVFVVGNVNKPGMFSITDGSESSFLKAVALSGGLGSCTGSKAYIYRVDNSSGRKMEIPVDVKNIVARKSPDVPLYANDMLYITSSTAKQAGAKALTIIPGMGLSVASLMLYSSR